MKVVAAIGLMVTVAWCASAGVSETGDARLANLEREIAKAEKAGAKTNELFRLWLDYTKRAWKDYRDDCFVKGFAGLCRYGKRPFGDVSADGRLVPHAKALRSLKAFPRAEKDIKFGQTLKSMGVAARKTVALKDFWNPTNVTAALQRLVDDPEVTTIVIDRMPTPWYLDGVTLGRNVNGKRILFKQGAEMLRCPDLLRHVLGKRRAAKALFYFQGAKNVIVESDAPKPEDVHIGFFRDYATRHKFNRQEGASAVIIDDAGMEGGCDTSRNIVLRNLRLAECEQDGLGVGGSWAGPEDIYVERVIFDSNFRQGVSPGCYQSLFFKECRFDNTRDGSPAAGCDIEPYEDYLCVGELYFFDCVFAHNEADGLCFAVATHDPCVCLVKRCKFVANGANAIDFVTRPDDYIRLGRKPAADIRVEDCAFEVTGPAFNFSPCPIQNLTVRDCTIRDLRSPDAQKRGLPLSPIQVSFSKDFKIPELPAGVKPRIRFENVTAEGFDRADAIGFTDETGMLSLHGVFGGSVKLNGKAVDLSKFDYDAPDLHEPRTRPVDLRTLRPPKDVPAADATAPVSNAKLCFAGAWWMQDPLQSYYFYAEKGRTVTFDLSYSYPSYVKPTATNALFVVSASGKRTSVGFAEKGENHLVFVAPETGWHRFAPGDVLNGGATIGSGREWYVTNVKGAHFAWQADTASDSFAKFFLRDAAQPYTGYFEVPAGGKPCRLRVSFGAFELRDPAGNLVESVKTSDYRGRHVFTIQPKTDKAEIWSFTTPAGAANGWVRALRFYAPLNGIWADTPEDLPCVYAEHFTPEVRKTASGSAVKVRLPVELLSAEDKKLLEKAKEERRAFVEKRGWTESVKKTEQKIADLRKLGQNDDIQKQVNDLRAWANALSEVADLEARVAKETPEEFEVGAFCQAFAMRIVHDPKPTTFLLGKALEPLGLHWSRGFVIYDDPAKLMPLVKMILDASPRSAKDDLLDKWRMYWTERRAEIDASIDRVRKADCTYQLKDEKGRPLANAEVEVRQVASAFNWGCGALCLGQLGAKNAAYEAKLSEFFNQLTTTFTVDSVMTKPGTYRFDDSTPDVWRRPPPDRTLAFARQHGMLVKGQPLCCDHWHPAWAKRQTKAEAEELYRTWFKAVADRYGKSYWSFDVVNEAFLARERNPSFPLYGGDEEVPFVDWAFREAAKVFPQETTLAINMGIDATEWRDHGERYYKLCKRIVDSGTRLDAIGFQFHLFSAASLKSMLNLWYFNPDMLRKTYETFASLKKPLYITEITIPSTLLPGRAGEELQAEAATELYRFWFSRPEIHGITWWNLMDGAAFANEDTVKGALLDDFAREKVAYQSLRDLITREFNTSFRTKTDAEGRIRFRGFRGTYTISFKNAAGNGLSSRTFELR